MRLNPIPPVEFSPEQRALFEQIQDITQGRDRGFTMAREDGAMLGPYNAMLHFPMYGSAVWAVNTALSKHTTLPKAVHEIAILVTGSRFSARYEIYAHEFTAAKAGLSLSQVSALAAGSRPANLSEEEGIAFDVAMALSRGAQLPESTYQAASTAFGKDGIAELVYLVGFYSMISVLLNGFDVPVPGRDSDGQ